MRIDVSHKSASTLAADLHLSFDLLLLGDGSGTQLGRPAGWFVFAFSKNGSSWTFGGCTSAGTTNQAELAPYLHALWAIDSQHFPGGEPLPRPIRVEVVSDSELIVKGGNRQYARKANGPLWAQLEHFENRGYLLHFTHVPRNSTPFHEEADRLSRKWRLSAEELCSIEASR